nr:hypothetical protein [Neobacillus sp. Marseille-Q6967]
MLKTLVRFNTIVMELNKMLRMKFIKGNKDYQHPIGQTLYRALDNYNNRELVQAQLEFGRMEFFIVQLKQLEQNDPKMLKAFRELIKKHPENYPGYRFEVEVAASLFKKEITFYKQESPDFKIVDDKYGEVFIECGSARLAQNKDVDLTYKICSTINKKAKKKYANSNTALFIDITNIFFHLQQNERLPDTEELRGSILDCLKETTFGNITLFSNILNNDLDRFERSYLRVDSEAIDGNLVLFLDDHYPITSHFVPNPVIPSEG